MALDSKHNFLDLSRILASGETPLALEHIGEPLIGQDRISDQKRARRLAPRRDQAPSSMPAKILLAPVAAVAYLISGPSWSIDFDRVLGGIITEGEPGSAADQLRTAVHASGVNESRLLITSARLGLVRGTPVKAADRRSPAGPATAYALAFAINLEAVTGLERRGWLLQRGRLRIAFADGSVCILMTGMLSTKATHRLLAAFSGAASECRRYADTAERRRATAISPSATSSDSATNPSATNSDRSSASG